MKIQALLVAGIIAMTTGCTSVNSNNFAHKDKTLPTNIGDAITTKEVKNIDPQGNASTHIEKMTQTPSAFNKDIVIYQLTMARDAAVAKQQAQQQAAAILNGNAWGGGNGSYPNTTAGPIENLGYNPPRN